MKNLLVLFLFPLVISLAKAQNPDTVLTNGGKLKPEQAIMDVRHYSIALNVDFSQKSIEGYTTIDVIMANQLRYYCSTS